MEYSAAMYRVTYKHASPPTASNELNKSATTTRQIYRWGAMWGILQGQTWSAERRRLLAEEGGGEICLESVAVTSVASPPPVCDDVWTEKVMRLGPWEYNGVWMCSGSAEEIRRWCLEYGMPVPEALPATATETSTVYESNKDHKPKKVTATHTVAPNNRPSRCLIEVD